uniref:Uncharacterized protein n=1 Tax=Arundo donax TaxID=35708 RepID=A0A0A9GRW1_ARUDO
MAPRSTMLHRSKWAGTSFNLVSVIAHTTRADYLHQFYLLCSSTDIQPA